MKVGRYFLISKDDFHVICATFLGVGCLLALALIFGSPRSAAAWSKQQHSTRKVQQNVVKYDEFDAMKCMSGPWNTCLPDGVQSF
jgi:hypothetical protein